MNKIWSLGIIIGLIIGVYFNLDDSIFNTFLTIGQDSFKLTLQLCLNACFFNGILNIAKATGSLEKLAFFTSPILKHLFKDASNETLSYISLQLFSNFFGLGALASISGLKAMKSLSKNNPNTLTHSMLILFILNVSGLSLFPTSVISLRQLYTKVGITTFIPFAILTSLFALIITLPLIGVKKHD